MKKSTVHPDALAAVEGMPSNELSHAKAMSISTALAHISLSFLAYGIGKGKIPVYGSETVPVQLLSKAGAWEGTKRGNRYPFWLYSNGLLFNWLYGG